MSKTESCEARARRVARDVHRLIAPPKNLREFRRQIEVFKQEDADERRLLREAKETLHAEDQDPSLVAQAEAELAEALNRRLYAPGPNPSRATMFTLLAALHDHCLPDNTAILDPRAGRPADVAQANEEGLWALYVAGLWCVGAIEGNTDRLDTLEGYFWEVEAALQTGTGGEPWPVSPRSQHERPETVSEKAKAQEIARKVGRLLAPHQDVVRKCQGEFEALTRESEARWQNQDEAQKRAKEAIKSEWEAVVQGKAKRVLTDRCKPPGRGYKWHERVTDVHATEPLDTTGDCCVYRDEVIGGWVPAEVYDTLENGLEEPPWQKRERPFDVRVMRLALLHDEALPEASRLLGPPENDSPQVAFLREDFRIHLSGICKTPGTNPSDVFDHARPDHELTTWDDDALDGLQDDLEYVKAELAERARQAGGAAPTATDAAQTTATEDAQSKRRKRRTERLARVLAFVKENPDLSEREVARQTKVPASTFRAWAEYKALRKMQAGEVPSGHKTSDGTVEAYDD